MKVDKAKVAASAIIISTLFYVIFSNEIVGVFRVTFIGKPRLICQSTLEVNSVAQGSATEARFCIKNEGDADLHIYNVRINCSCSGLEMIKENRLVRFDNCKVQPGESIHCVVRLIARESSEHQESTVYFQTNDINISEHKISIKFTNVYGGMFTVPYELHCSRKDSNDNRVYDVKVYDSKKKPREVVKVDVANPEQLCIEWMPETPAVMAGKHFVLGTVKTSIRKQYIGPINTVIAVHFKDDYVESLRIPVIGQSLMPFELSSALVHFPIASSSGSIYQTNIYCYSVSDEPYSLTITKCPHDVQVEIMDSENPKSKVLRIQSTQAYIETMSKDDECKITLQAKNRHGIYPLVLKIRKRPLSISRM